MHSGAVYWDGILWILSNTFCDVSSYGFKFHKEKIERIFPVILACVRKHGKVSYEHTRLSKKMDGIWNRYNLKSTGRIYTFGVLKCSEKFKVLDLP